MEFKINLLWLFVILLSILPILSLQEASFYGNSYVSVAFQEAKSTTSIHFKFRTYMTNAFILLIAGSTDFCLIRLENSRLKVNINLGAGESELLSQNSIKINDFKWHDVFIKRHNSDLTMIIDGTHKTQKNLPGRFFELNIHYGLFVGGHGNFTEIFFGHVENFRGCLSDLEYNGIMVLESARLRKPQTFVKGITWNCAAEFGANVKDPISFVEDDNYMVVLHNKIQKDFELQMDIKTLSSQALLFYNSGIASKRDFFSIEIWNNNIRSLIKIDERQLMIEHKENVSDGNWHKIYFHVSPTIVEIIINGKAKQGNNTLNVMFDFAESSYFGGLEVGKRSRAMSKGCQFCDTSLKGCIRNLAVANKQTGLRDVHISEGLLPGCMWQYPCLKNPCKDDTICIQRGLNSFTCECQKELCISSNHTEGYKVTSKNSLAIDLEILSVVPINVVEGQSTVITTENLYMILDYHKYGIKESGIYFYVIEDPLYGNLVIDIWPHKKNVFSLADVALDKIYYLHDGSENSEDYITLEIEFLAQNSFILPVYLQGRFHFTLPISVIKINDPPLLLIPTTTALRIVQGSKATLGKEYLHAEDPDNTPEQLLFTVIHSDHGYFEHAKSPDVAISSFTQQEINDNKISYVHHVDDTTDFYVSFQVSDGIEVSTVQKLRISVSPEHWRLENNTGLVLLYQMSAIITSYNLSFTSNLQNSSHILKFYITKKPEVGIIEVEKNIDVWTAAQSFTSKDIKQHRVRYRHLKGKPDLDEFQFQTSFNKSGIYTFRVLFAKCKLFSQTPNKIILNDTWETVISSNRLSFKTEPISTTTLTYIIIEPPKYGYVFSVVSKYHLKSCDTFTQEDILLQNIKYRFHLQPYSVVHDYFLFMVLSPGCNNKTDNFTITYNPSNELRAKVKTVLTPLHIIEGMKAVINSSHLNIIGNFFQDLNFVVTKKPEHGILQINNATNISHFTLSNVQSNQLTYIHDNSETKKDSFTFMALSSIEDNLQYVDRFLIDIELKNDNSPVRSADKIFRVVVGGEKILTNDYLMYSDTDLNTKSSDIMYTFRESLNGHFCNIENPRVKIFEFTQADINDNKILFKHKGPEYAKVRLWVTDGHFHVSGILEIQASVPFINIITTKKLIVEQGKIATLSKEHLTYSTNLFAYHKNVVYEITTKPTFGKIVHSNSLKVVHNFTQEDINMYNINYLNDIATGSTDEIGLIVHCKGAANVGHMDVSILPSNYWLPLQIRRLGTLIVEESTGAPITRNLLEVFQEGVSSSSITYYIHKEANFGSLILVTSTGRTIIEDGLTSFTQNLINEERIFFVQSEGNQTKDEIVFNVTNGIIWHNNLKFKIQVIPDDIRLTTRNLTVVEGGESILTPAHLFTTMEYYKKKITDYKIMQDAKHGCLKIRGSCKKGVFSQKDLESHHVVYANDHSEHSYDVIVIVGNVGSKVSLPVTLYINIMPVNDQKPKIVNNTGLIMWQGGRVSLTNEILAAVDNDEPQEVLTYEIRNCWLGIVSLITNISVPITHFTQNMINRNMIVFSNLNGTRGNFTFVVSDGLHVTKEIVFPIKTKPVNLTLQTNPLQLFPLEKKFLTPYHLNSYATDPDRIVEYEIITTPSYGRIILDYNDGERFTVISRFTQEDVNKSRVFYEHTHQFTDFYANDSFVFNVRAFLVPPLYKQVFNVDITLSAGGLNTYINVPKILVDEGGSAIVSLNLSGMIKFLGNYAGIRSPIIHGSVMQPKHGQISLKNAANITTFNQQQLETGEIYYQHDHSDSLEDQIPISLYLIPGYMILCNLTLPVIVNPVNDKPFKLVTRHPHLTVVQNGNHTITRDELFTDDEDTPPSQIKYIVITEPTQGKLVLLPEMHKSVLYFTQEDIDEKRLIYIHNTSILSDSFYFRVSDGDSVPQFTIFNITAISIEVTIDPGLSLYLTQGSESIFLSEDQFIIETNSDKNKLVFRVIEDLKHGVLYVRKTPSVTFSFDDLISNEVVYLQTDMSASNDSLKIQANIISGDMSIGNSLKVHIFVKPLIDVENTVIRKGERKRITLKILDATSLAKLTNSNPKYVVVNLTEFIQLRKIIRRSGEDKNILDVIVTNFTHREIEKGFIYMEVKNTSNFFFSCQGYMTFILSANNVQPASGRVFINFEVPAWNELNSTLSGPSNPASHEGGYVSPNMTRDYFFIVSMAFGVVVLGVSVIVIIKCKALKVEELSKQEECAQNMLTNQGNNLEPPQQTVIKHLDDLNNSYVPITLPQCKITPLAKPEKLAHTFYPYGSEDHPEEWSSYEATGTQSPTRSIMLRRNQYWV